MLIYRYLLSIIVPIFLCIGTNFQAQTDSIQIELKKIKEKNALLTLKDSIRAAIVKEELDNIVSPKSKELDQYKKELLKIKREDSLRLAEQKATIEHLRKDVEPFPVKLYHKKLFNFYSGLGPFSAKDRAINTEKQIQTIFDSKVYQPDSLRLQSNEEYINILYQGDIISSISREDALWENVSQDSLAIRHKELINSSIQEARDAAGFQNTAMRWLMAVGIVIGFVVLTNLIRRFFRWLMRKLVFDTVNETEGIKIKNYQFLDRNELKKIVVKILKYVHVALFVVLFGIAISSLFSIFPATESWAYTLLDWIWLPIKDLSKSLYYYLPNLFRILVIIVIARYISKVLRYFSLEIEKEELKIKGFHSDWAKPTFHLLRICLFAFTLIIIFPYLPGSDTSAFRGISVFFGVILSLGSSSAISNTIAGFIITYMRPFKIGDWIKVNDVTGEVLEKTALVTRLRTINNEDITVPNSMILTNKTINYSSPCPEKGLILNVDIDVSQDVPFHKVNELLIIAAKNTHGIIHVPEPYVFKLKIKENSIAYQLNATTYNPERMYFIQSDLVENVLKIFREQNIDLITPQIHHINPNSEKS